MGAPGAVATPTRSRGPLLPAALSFLLRVPALFPSFRGSLLRSLCVSFDCFFTPSLPPHPSVRSSVPPSLCPASLHPSHPPHRESEGKQPFQRVQAGQRLTFTELCGFGRSVSALWPSLATEHAVSGPLRIAVGIKQVPAVALLEPEPRRQHLISSRNLCSCHTGVLTLRGSLSGGNGLSVA